MISFLHISAQLTLEQHRFELHVSTLWEYFSIVNNIAVHGPLLVESVAAEEPQTWRPNCKLYMD